MVFAYCAYNAYVLCRLQMYRGRQRIKAFFDTPKWIILANKKVNRSADYFES